MTADPGRATDSRPWQQALRRELDPRSLLTSLNAGLIVYFFVAILAVSMAALVFSDLFPYALGSVLVGTALLVAISVLLGADGGSIPTVQDAPSAVLALAAASVVTASAAAGGDATLATVVVLMAGSTIAYGVACLILGSYRLGALVRFLPYPVLGGFLAGTGWLLVVGGLRVTVAPEGLELFDDAAIGRWLPAFALGLLAFVAVRRWQSPLVLPVLLAVALAAFYVVAFAADRSVETLSADGWLLGPFPDDIGVMPPFDPALLSQVSWPALVAAIPLAAPAVLLGVIGLLLNSSSLELVLRRELQLDRELVVTGGANLASGLLGGLPGYPAVSVTIVNHTLGRGRRLPGLIVAVLLLATLAGGMAALALIPRMLLGGLLVYIGVTLLHRWVIEVRSSMTRTDHLVVLAILLVIVLTELLWGVVLGLGLAVVLFVVDYSRVSLVRYEMTGRDFRSQVQRGPRDAELLRAHGSELVIMALQGYLFFGTAYQLVERVRRHMDRPEEARVRAVLLDLTRVSGLDSTALHVFDKLVASLRAGGVELILTGLRDELLRQLRAGGLGEASGDVHVFADLDLGAEWAEDLVLSAHREAGGARTLEAELAALLPDEVGVAELVRRMRRQEYATGEVVLRQGEDASALYLIEGGRLSVRLEREGLEPVRLTTIRPGGLVGEIGFFLGTQRSATVVADEPSVLRVLTRAEWDALVEDEPELARLVQLLSIRALGERLMDSNRALDALLR